MVKMGGGDDRGCRWNAAGLCSCTNIITGGYIDNKSRSGLSDDDNDGRGNDERSETELGCAMFTSLQV